MYIRLLLYYLHSGEGFVDCIILLKNHTRIELALYEYFDLHWTSIRTVLV